MNYNEMNTSDWRAIDSAHHLHSFTDTKALAEEGCRVITRAGGVYIWDSDGKRLLDGMAGLWCVNAGYGRKELAEAARDQLLELPYYNTGPYLERCWNELAEHPLVGETRGVGFLRALELVKDKHSREFFDPVGEVGQICRDFCFNNGLVMRALRDTMVISPPLVMTRDHIDELIELVVKCLDLTANEL